jgi:hypothetical protein
MKVSSAPFEAPIGSASRGTASDGLARALTEKASLHLVSAPTAKSSVKAGLDAATRDALLRLANLAKEKEKEKENEREKEKSNSSERPKKKVISVNDDQSFVEAVAVTKNFQPASVAHGSTSSPASSSASSMKDVLERVRLTFEAARKQVGRQVYREAVKRQTLVQLEKEFNLDLNVEELENFTNAPDRSASTEDALGLYSSGLKRVA